jgi:hypothetical protein
MFSSHSVYTRFKSDMIRLSHNHLHPTLLADLLAFKKIHVRMDGVTVRRSFYVT